jgi:predicted AAA+ superfamily ATPase
MAGMERKIYRELRKWKAGGAKKPLMVIGARQVGKTYIVEEFCRREFPERLFFNLFDRADLVSVFAEKINTREKIRRFELLVGRKIDFENTVIFFDEVQESEDIIAALKYFAESETKYKIICAGSLLGVKLNRFTKSFPVGKVEMLSMRPMDFEEYLQAGGEDLLIGEIKSCFEKNRTMPEPLHEKCMKYFRIYLCTGGMPEAIANVIKEDNDVLRFNSSILTNIRSSYLNDMNKYVASTAESTKIEAIYNSIPVQLGNKSNKFQYAMVKKGARSRDFSSALDWLVSSEMIYVCHKVSAPNMPLKGYADEGSFKIFLNDTGILCNMLDIRFSPIMLDMDFYYKGVIVENYVAAQFAALGIPLFYWKSENTAEVDFLIDSDNGIVPVEVKSGKNKASPSLDLYRSRYKPALSLKTRNGNFGLKDGVKSIPLYAVFCIHR